MRERIRDPEWLSVRIGSHHVCTGLHSALFWKVCSVRDESAQVQFAAYKQFCDDTTVEKQRAIKEANAKMEQLSAAIQKVEAHFCNRASGPGMWYLVP